MEMCGASLGPPQLSGVRMRGIISKAWQRACNTSGGWGEAEAGLNEGATLRGTSLYLLSLSRQPQGFTSQYPPMVQSST